MSVSLSTHVLDVERGRPAAGVRVELWQEDLVTAGETDGDGRIPQLAADLEPGVYRVVLEPYALADLLEYFSHDSLGALGLLEELGLEAEANAVRAVLAVGDARIAFS